MVMMATLGTPSVGALSPDFHIEHNRRMGGAGGVDVVVPVAVGVLGPLLLQTADGDRIPVTSARQRRLLAALALHAGAEVGCNTLAELVWGDGQPADPDAALQTNV